MKARPKTAKRGAKGWAGYKAAKGATKGASKAVRRKRPRAVDQASGSRRSPAPSASPPRSAFLLSKIDRRKAAGKAKGAVVLRAAGKRDYDDVTLARKVESELFRPADVPKGSISVNVNDGVVELRGELPDPKQIDELGDNAKKIDGVKDVRNLLSSQRTRADARGITARRSGVFGDMLTYSSLTGALAAERERALREKARDRMEAAASAASCRSAPPRTPTRRALLRLARLDSQGRPPAGTHHRRRGPRRPRGRDVGRRAARRSPTRSARPRRSWRCCASAPSRCAATGHAARPAPHAALAPPPAPARRRCLSRVSATRLDPASPAGEVVRLTRVARGHGAPSSAGIRVGPLARARRMSMCRSMRIAVGPLARALRQDRLDDQEPRALGASPRGRSRGCAPRRRRPSRGATRDSR